MDVTKQESETRNKNGEQEMSARNEEMKKLYPISGIKNECAQTIREIFIFY